MRDRRVQKRFDVDGLSLVKAKTMRSPSGERLLTVSRSGCGFCSLLDEFKFKVGDVVDCEFNYGSGAPFHLQGVILYLNPYPMAGQIGRYYGIRFTGDYEKHMNSLIDELDGMMTDGKVKLAK